MNLLFLGISSLLDVFGLGSSGLFAYVKDFCHLMVNLNDKTDLFLWSENSNFE